MTDGCGGAGDGMARMCELLSCRGQKFSRKARMAARFEVVIAHKGTHFLGRVKRGHGLRCCRASIVATQKNAMATGLPCVEAQHDWRLG